MFDELSSTAAPHICFWTFSADITSVILACPLAEVLMMLSDFPEFYSRICGEIAGWQGFST